MNRWSKQVAAFFRQGRSKKLMLLWGTLVTVLLLWVLALSFYRSNPLKPVYSAFSDSPTAVRPKAIFSYHAFVPEGIKEQYLEVFVIGTKNRFLRLQHPGITEQSVLEFSRTQTTNLLNFIDKYIEQLPEDKKEKRKNHMVGTFHNPIAAKNGKRLAIQVDYTSEKLMYYLIFGEKGSPPKLDLSQLKRLRDTIATAMEETAAI